jgi:hypothetical protein
MPAPAVIHWVSPLVMSRRRRASPVLHLAVDHVGDGLEAAVRVPRGALGLARRVLHLAHLVHVDERVQRALADPGERPPDRNPSPSKPRGEVVTASTGRGRPCAAGAGTTAG